MQKRVLTVIILIVGISLGVTFLPTAWTAIGNADNMWLNNSLTNGLIGAIIFYIISLAIVEPITIGVKRIEKQLNELSLTYILFGVIGAILGLTLGFRGRRGLDILNALQKEEGIAVEMYDGDFEDISEVDSKLIKLAKLLDGVIVTNDYNLNKVSEFQNVAVLNINALANAVKPVVIPGENMNVLVVKAGTERQQGVAYLDDGTMVVVEDGQHYMNEHIEVVVTSALQTAAGRMIFAKPAHSSRNIKDDSPEKKLDYTNEKAAK